MLLHTVVGQRSWNQKRCTYRQCTQQSSPCLTNDETTNQFSYHKRQPLFALSGYLSRSLLHNLSHGRPSLDSLQPSSQVGELLAQVQARVGERGHDEEPRQERRIGKAILPTNEPLTTLQRAIQHARNPPDLVVVPLLCARNGLVVESVEPGSLAKVRALAGHLEVQPLLGRVVVRSALGEAEGVLLVISLDKVFDDGAGFPEVQTGVGVFNGGNTAVGVELFERLLLHLGELKEFRLIGEVEFLEDDGHLPRVGAGSMAVEDDRLERHFQLAIAQGQVRSSQLVYRVWSGCRK